MSTSELKYRLEDIERRVGEAARRAGRTASKIRLLAVTKGHPASSVEAVVACGIRRIGENRVHEAESKKHQLGLDVQWHMVGNLQRNKVLRAIGVFDVVESVGSLRLARSLSDEVAGAGLDSLRILVQVNTSGEDAKAGFDEIAAVDGVGEIAEFANLEVEGLMTMAPWTTEEAVLRGTFRRARSLFERCAEQITGFQPRILSMGMSNDFEIAIEEGSTEIRLGTALLGERTGP